jgi:pilus assembly protein CpaD
MRNAKPALKALPLLAAGLIAASALSGCAAFGQRDHIEVGSIPDDYRTRHPITIAEKHSQLMVPVGNAPRQLSYADEQVIGGFLDRYRTAGSGAIQIMAPGGARNSGAAGMVANQVAHYAASQGFGDRIIMNQYAAPAGQATPPVIIGYSAIKASAGPCGKWPADMGVDAENKQYHNFGCAYQNNVAAQIANPMDLLGPRLPGMIDASDRGQVITDYRTTQGSWSPNIQY